MGLKVVVDVAVKVFVGENEGVAVHATVKVGVFVNVEVGVMDLVGVMERVTVGE